MILLRIQEWGVKAALISWPAFCEEADLYYPLLSIFLQSFKGLSIQSKSGSTLESMLCYKIMNQLIVVCTFRHGSWCSNHLVFTAHICERKLVNMLNDVLQVYFNEIKHFKKKWKLKGFLWHDNHNRMMTVLEMLVGMDLPDSHHNQGSVGWKF